MELTYVPWSTERSPIASSRRSSAASTGSPRSWQRLNRREERREELTVIAHELRNLNESLQAITYAALGTQGPQVRRRRTG